MKNSLLFVFLLMGAGLFAQTKISFEKKATWEEVLAKAKEENKLIFVDVYATWCGPCKMMDKNVFTESSVAEYYNETFINAKFDSDTEEGGAVAQSFGVTALPTFLYVDGDGNLVSKTLGYQEADMFIENGKMAVMVGANFADYKKRFDGGDRDPAFVADYLEILAAKGDLDQSRDILLDMIKTDEWKNESVVNSYMTIMEPTDYDELFTFFLKNKAEFEKFAEAERVEMSVVNYVLTKSQETADSMEDLAKMAEDLFADLLPEQSTKYSSMVWMMVHEQEENWSGYVKSVKDYTSSTEVSYSELNSFAWNYYLHVDDEQLLKEGLDMALRSVEMESVYANVDTAACLYFKLGDKKNAQKYAEEAIRLGEEEGADISDTKILMKKIKAL